MSIAGCPTKRAMPRLILGLINPAYLQFFGLEPGPLWRQKDHTTRMNEMQPSKRHPTG